MKASTIHITHQQTQSSNLIIMAWRRQTWKCCAISSNLSRNKNVSSLPCWANSWAFPSNRLIRVSARTLAWDDCVGLSGSIWSLQRTWHDRITDNTFHCSSYNRSHSYSNRPGVNRTRQRQPHGWWTDGLIDRWINLQMCRQTNIRDVLVERQMDSQTDKRQMVGHWSDG